MSRIGKGWTMPELALLVMEVPDKLPNKKNLLVTTLAARLKRNPNGVRCKMSNLLRVRAGGGGGLSNGLLHEENVIWKIKTDDPIAFRLLADLGEERFPARTHTH